MKVFVDGVCEAPEGWVCVQTAAAAIDLVRTGEVQEISLAHDLGDAEGGTGQTVILWIEQAVLVGGFRPPIMFVHSARSSVRKQMEEHMRDIHRLAASR